MADLNLSWGQFGPYAAGPFTPGTVDTGGIAVTVGFNQEDEHAFGITVEEEVYVAPGEGFDPNSSLEIKGFGGEGGVDDTATTTFSFASTDAAFADEVQNVSFRLNDIDGGAFDDRFGGPSSTPYSDIVTIRAFDADGNPIPVTLTAGGAVSQSGDTLTGSGESFFNNEANSALVSIAGPVASIEVDYNNGGEGNQVLLISDVCFSTIEADVNEPPVATNDSAETELVTPVEIDVLTNDSDPDGDTLLITSATSTDGTVVINDNGPGVPQTVTFQANSGFVGATSISYTISDGNGGTASATVAVNVTDPGPGNRPPVANDDTETSDGSTIVIFPLGNDTDPDGDTLSITGATTGDGAVVDNGDGSLSFTPADGFVGDATIVYTITDGNNATDTGTITVTVTDEPPSDGLIDTDILTPMGGGVDAFAGLDEDPDPFDDLDTVEGTSGADLISTGDDDDVITGRQGDDTIFAGVDDDQVFGNQGNDSIVDAQGADTIDGGQGDDTIIAGVDTFLDDTDVGDPILAAANRTVDTNTDDGRDSVFGANGNDLILTGDDGDTVDGGQGNDTIDLGIDDDLAFGGAGDDEITGGHGSDTIESGDGDDIIIAGIETTDPALEQLDEGPDGIAGTADDDINPDNDRDDVWGGNGNDTITTGDDDDTIGGGRGDDLLDGGIDDDSIGGGEGNDTIIGGQGADTLNGFEDRDLFVGGNAGDVIDGGGGGDDVDTLDLTGTAPAGGRLDITFTSDDGEDGFVTFFDADGVDTGRLVFTEIENVIPCFTPGTVIATPLGERLVEDLREGDRIITRDNGLQEIRWMGRRDLTGHELARDPHLRPILVQAGSLGPNMPEHDIVVSPNHRMLVANDKTALFFEETEVLVAAKHLTGLDGVDEVDTLGVSYIHFMFDRHEVVLSNGVWTESFQPGDYTLKGMGNAQRNEIFELFPELETQDGLKDYTAARRALKRHEAALLTH
ncbi:Hint domain-containing protein [Pseudaestuariivita sp.]|uniref:Hint domain-containing protein n=1 Tax=Pseudaestuariivita sp. TaxID=2211669 RepID=UPI00405858DA